MGSVFARRFSSTGAALTGEFQISTYTSGSQSLPRVASDPDGDFVVAWNSLLQDGASEWRIRPSILERWLAAGHRVPGQHLHLRRPERPVGGVGCQRSVPHRLGQRRAGRPERRRLRPTFRYAKDPRPGRRRIGGAPHRRAAPAALPVRLPRLYTHHRRRRPRRLHSLQRGLDRDLSSRGSCCLSLSPRTSASEASSRSMATPPTTRPSRRSRWLPRATSSSPGAVSTRTARTPASSPAASRWRALRSPPSSRSTPSPSAFRTGRRWRRMAADASSSHGRASTRTTRASVSSPAGSRAPALPSPASSRSTPTPPSPSSSHRWRRARAAPSSSPGRAARTARTTASSRASLSTSGATLGSEFQVNTYTTGGQRYPSVATAADGDFVVVWESGQDGSGQWHLRAPVLERGQLPSASEFQVNTYTPSGQDRASVASDADGDFLVAWQSFGQDGSSHGVFARGFSSAGTPLEQRVPRSTPPPRTSSAVHRWRRTPAAVSSSPGRTPLATARASESSRAASRARAFLWPASSRSTPAPRVTSSTRRWRRTARATSSSPGRIPSETAAGYGVFAQRFVTAVITMDIDGDGAAEPLTDGLLVLRYLFGFRGATLVTGAVGGGCTRCDAPAIEGSIVGRGLTSRCSAWRVDGPAAADHVGRIDPQPDRSPTDRPGARWSWFPGSRGSRRGSRPPRRASRRGARTAPA